MSVLSTNIAQRWNDILKALSNKKNNPKQFQRFFIGGIEIKSFEINECKNRTYFSYNKKSHKKNYYLGGSFSNTYFTRREAQCMLLLLNEYTNEEIATCLNLSARTIEYYIKNMRNKTSCLSKSHLIKSIRKTNFYQTLDFSMADIDSVSQGSPYKL